MSKSILLARPHFFIVGEMRPFLEQEGYQLDKLESSASLQSQAKTSRGAVISLALSSSIEESAEEISNQLRNHNPGIALVFAALMDMKAATYQLQKVAAALGIDATILGVEARNLNHAGLGKPSTFLYIGKADLTNADSRKIAVKMLKKHV